MKQLLTISLLCIFFLNGNTHPRIGAQVWIEPGQTPGQIDEWFKILAENNMPVARLFIMWNYIEVTPGNYNFLLYDQAFAAAAKYDVKIQATLTANHGPAFADPKFWYRDQDGAIPTSDKQFDAAAVYIGKIVNHFKNHPALETWWLQNEPGQFNSHDSLAVARFQVWLRKKYNNIQSLNALWLTDFKEFESIGYSELWDQSGGFARPSPFLDWNLFWRDYMTSYLSWLTTEIRKHDMLHPLHVNPHAVFDILPKYDLPAWRGFLSSLGASIHPSWHLSMFERDDYALAISGICDVIRGASEPNPFWVSELQGGNNIWSGGNPLCPTSKDIAQWVWTGIGSGAGNIIFWLLNWRRLGGEAGEWSLLGYGNTASERLSESAKIAKTINDNAELFNRTKPLQSNITILLSPETMLILGRKDNWKDIEGRKAQAHIKAVMGCYKALTEMGIAVNLKQMDDYNWDPPAKQVLIMAHVASIPDKYVSAIKTFVEKGNKLIVTGLTGYFNENEENTFQSGFPLKDVFGASVREVKLIGNEFHVNIDGYTAPLPAHMWLSVLSLTTANGVANYMGETAGCRNSYGKGEVVWIPAMVDIGGWMGDNRPLAAFLSRETELFINAPFRFASHQPHILLKTLSAGDRFVTVITNGSSELQNVILSSPSGFKPSVLYSSNSGMITGLSNIRLDGRSTVVMVWTK